MTTLRTLVCRVVSRNSVCRSISHFLHISLFLERINPFLEVKPKIQGFFQGVFSSHCENGFSAHKEMDKWRKMTSTTDNRTLTLTLMVHIQHEAELDYDDFKKKIMRKKKKETEEDYEKRCKEEWERLLKEHGEEFELEEIEADCDWVSDDFQEIENWTSDVAEQLGVNQ